jgi:hypothetical protein
VLRALTECLGLAERDATIVSAQAA